MCKSHRLNLFLLFFFLLFPLLLLIASLPDAGAASENAPDGGAALTPKSDDFRSCELDRQVWNFINPFGDGALEMTGSQAQISVPAGVSHDITAQGATAPRIMQTVEDRDFEVVVKFESAMDEKYQSQGVLVQEDGAKMLRFGFHHDGVNMYIHAYSIAGGQMTVLSNVLVSNTKPQWMRIGRTGNLWKQAYSADGQNWQPVKSSNFTLNVTAVGLFAANAGPNPAHSAKIDFFFNTTSPISPEDGNRSLDVTINGQGSVVKDPDLAHYACGKTVELTALPDPGWRFSSWSGGLSGFDALKTIVVTRRATIAANFAKEYNPVFLPAVVVYPPFSGSSEQEPNDNWRQANGSLIDMQKYHGKFPSADDKQDYYFFFKGVLGPVSLRLSEIGVGHDYDLTLRDSDLQVVGHSGEIGNKDEKIEKVLGPGLYYVQVYNRSETGSSQSYSLLVDYIPPPLPEPTSTPISPPGG